MPIILAFFGLILVASFVVWRQKLALGPVGQIAAVCVSAIQHSAYLLMVAAVVILLFFAPPRFEVVHESYTRLDTAEGEEVDAHLAWRQNAIRFFGVITLFPTTTELVLISDDRSVSWSLRDGVEERLVSELGLTQATPKWRYAQGTIIIIALLLLGGVATQSADIVRDMVDWRVYRRRDTFLAYREFLSSLKGESRSALYQLFARRRLRERLREYVEYLRIITTANESGKLRTWFLDVLGRVNPAHGLPIYIEYRADVTKGSARVLIQRRIEQLNAALRGGKVHQPEEVRQRIQYLKDVLAAQNFHQFDEIVRDDFLRKLEASISKMFVQVFDYILTDQVFYIVPSTKGAKANIFVDYSVRSTDSVYSQKSDQRPVMEKDLYAGVIFDWSLKVEAPGVAMRQVELASDPESQFVTFGKSVEVIFGGMSVTAFIRFGKRFLAELGIKPNRANFLDRLSKEHIKAAMSAQARRDFIKEILQDTAENALRDHKDEIEHFTESIFGRLDNAEDALLRGVASELGGGGDGGDGGGDGGGGE